MSAVRLCCRKHEAEDLKGDIFGRHFIVCPTCQDKRCAHADDCANSCTGQQPAQPGSGEVALTRYGLQWNGPREFVCTPMADGYWTPWHLARDALAAAQRRVAELEAALKCEAEAALAERRRVLELERRWLRG